MAEEKDERLVDMSATNRAQRFPADAQDCPDREQVRRLAVERDSAMHLAYELSEDKEATEEALRREMEERQAAQSAAATASTGMHVAERRAEEASQAATSATFGFYLLLAVLIAVLVVFVLWTFASPDRAVTIVRPAVLGLITGLFMSCRLKSRDDCRAGKHTSKHPG